MRPGRVRTKKSPPTLCEICHKVRSDSLPPLEPMNVNRKGSTWPIWREIGILQNGTSFEGTAGPDSRGDRGQEVEAQGYNRRRAALETQPELDGLAGMLSLQPADEVICNQFDGAQGKTGGWKNGPDGERHAKKILTRKVDAFSKVLQVHSWVTRLNVMDCA